MLLDQTAFASSLAISNVDQRRAAERRSSLRIALPFHTIVRGVHSGQFFEERGQLGNLSATGLYLCLERPVSSGSSLFVVVRFVFDDTMKRLGPGVALRGKVLRCEQQQDNRWGTALVFFRHRFLFVDSVNVS